MAYLKKRLFANYWESLLQDWSFSSKAEICQFSTSKLRTSHVKLVKTIALLACRYVPPEQAKVVASVHASISGSSASSTSSTPEVKPLKSLLGEAAPTLHLNKGTPSQVSNGCWAQNCSAVLVTLSVALEIAAAMICSNYYDHCMLYILLKYIHVCRSGTKLSLFILTKLIFIIFSKQNFPVW